MKEIRELIEKIGYIAIIIFIWMLIIHIGIEILYNSYVR